MKIKIEIDIPDDLLAEINIIIKELDISLDDYVERALRKSLEEYNQNKTEI